MIGGKALQLQEMIESSRRPAKVLAVTSGKGGVGKSNISANLAICLAASDEKVLLVDGDISLGNLDIIMDLTSRYTIRHLINGQKRIEEIVQTGPYGLDIICGGSGLEQLANLNEFQRYRLTNELNKMGDEYDSIIIDTAAGIYKSVAGFCLCSDHTLVVTTPEATAMTDAYAMIKVLSKNNYTGKISLIVNMAETISEGKKTYHQIANVAMRFLDTEVYNAGVLLKDEKLISAVRLRSPVVLSYPKSRISRSLAALAAKLSKSSAVKASNDGYFKKVVEWFF